MNIRLAEKDDLEQILKIYETAREFMRKTGNPTQWGSTYPPKELLREDTEKRRLYVVEGEGGLCGAFMFFVGEEPTYKEIEGGKWLSQKEYGVIHRVASNGTEKGVLSAILSFCSERIKNLRIDTHENNKVMQTLLEKNGFKRCGIIYVQDGTPRIAYQRTE